MPLAAAALGIAGTILGVVLAQQQASKRDAVAWQRQQRQWERDDEARTFDHRRDAYVDFYEQLRDMALIIYNHGMGLSDEPDQVLLDGLPEGFQSSAFRSLQRLQIYATDAVALAASGAYSTCWRWGSAATYGKDDDGFYARQEEYDQAAGALLGSIRADLKVPNEQKERPPAPAETEQALD